MPFVITWNIEILLVVRGVEFSLVFKLLAVFLVRYDASLTTRSKKDVAHAPHCCPAYNLPHPSNSLVLALRLGMKVTSILSQLPVGAVVPHTLTLSLSTYFVNTQLYPALFDRTGFLAGRYCL